MKKRKGKRMQHEDRGQKVLPLSPVPCPLNPPSAAIPLFPAGFFIFPFFIAPIPGPSGQQKK
jgi:hypothetical protein